MNIPSKESLIKSLLNADDQEDCSVKNVIVSAVQDKIDKFKLPYRIFTISGKLTLTEVGEGTEACLCKFITCSKEMEQIKEYIRVLAKEKDPVLLIGATGTGKELLARALHGNRDGKFIAVNCAGLPSELIESMMFGHVAGSFTGAIKTKQGLMAAANDGTFFLDEINSLPLSSQGKFLRVLQEGRITKVGAEVDEAVNCRIVCATNKCLRELVQQERFREDLYARISTIELNISPLSARKEDIEMIISSFEGGPEFLQAINNKYLNLNTEFNVRSLQQLVRRHKLLGWLPSIS